jgi:glucokinase
VTDPCLLIADIGGTNARFALARPETHGYEHELTLRCEDFDTPEQAVRHYLEHVDMGSPDAICFAVAGPVVDGSVVFTNSHWRIEEENLSRVFNSASAKLLNDFAAVALAIPALGASDLMAVGNNEVSLPSHRDYCVGVIGPGTGLGAAGLLKVDSTHRPLITESGHAGFAPMTALQAEVHRVLTEQYGRVSNERLISGPGVKNLCSALANIKGQEMRFNNAGEIFEVAQAGEDLLASQTVELFFEVLGQVAGDFALSIGAFDGVYLAGGVIQRYGRQLQESSFRQTFEDKGRLSAQLTRTPSALITHAQPGLLGASEMARSIAEPC